MSILFTVLHAETQTAASGTSSNTTGNFSLPPPPATLTPSDSEKKAYCNNIQDLAQAQDWLDTGTNITGRFGETDSNPGVKQLVIGAQKSLSKHLQGKAGLKIAKLTCELYDDSLDVGLITKYEMASITQQVAKQQVTELENILHLVDDEITATEKRKDAGNATMADIIALTQQRQQIYQQYITAQTNALVPSIPELPQVDVQKAMSQVNDITRELQAEINYQQSLQAWDIALIAGWQKPTSDNHGTITADIPPYGLQTIPYSRDKVDTFVAITFSYNIFMEPYKHKLADSINSLMAYRRQQNDGLEHQVIDLQKDISNTINLQRNSLTQIDEQIHHLGADLNRLQGFDTVDALNLRPQIRINLAIATMEDHLARYTIQLLTTDNHAQSK